MANLFHRNTDITCCLFDAGKHIFAHLCDDLAEARLEDILGRDISVQCYAQFITEAHLCNGSCDTLAVKSVCRSDLSFFDALVYKLVEH